MLIAQISDIHFGPMLNRESFRIAVKEINEMNPDAVLVTGDLAENGNISEFRAASKCSKEAENTEDNICERKPRLPLHKVICFLKIFSVLADNRNWRGSHNSAQLSQTR